jgi:hypothetical protein
MPQRSLRPCGLAGAGRVLSRDWDGAAAVELTSGEGALRPKVWTRGISASLGAAMHGRRDYLLSPLRALHNPPPRFGPVMIRHID